MIASNRRFLMYSFSKDAHSITRMSTWMPSSFSEAWTISATFLRSSFPWFVRSSNVNGWSFLTRTPSAFVSVQPAAARSARAFAMSYGYVGTSGLCAHVPGL